MSAVDREVDSLLQDYIALYAKDTLPRWRALFLPAFIASARNEDGSVTTWTLDEFYDRQRRSFASGKPVREALRDVAVERNGSLARVGAEFVWTDGEVERVGRLMMLLIAEHARLRVHSLTFSYHG